MVASKTTPTAADRFWAKVRQTEYCWLWTGSANRKGYGNFWPVSHRRPGSRTMLAHRFSWELHFGPIPRGLFVLHECDNPFCVRPDHLFLGTQVDNMRDCHRKDRNPTWRPRTHCPHGHPLIPSNTYVQRRPKGVTVRICKTCQRAAIHRQYLKDRQDPDWVARKRAAWIAWDERRHHRSETDTLPPSK
jgi:hypothetical protein